MKSTENSSGYSPWSYVIGLYLAFGITQGLLVIVPSTMFKLLGFSNQVIGIISGLGFVAIARFLYAPWLDSIASKRTLSLFTVSIAAMALLGIGGIIFMQLQEQVFMWTMIAALLTLVLVASAHETAADGYYIRALDSKLQAQFIGVKTAMIRIGIISATMGLLLGATKIAQHFGAISVESEDKTGFYFGFSAAYAFAALLLVFFFFWNKAKMPVLEEDQPVKHNQFGVKEVFREYFTQKGVILIVIMIFFYRFGEGFLTAMKFPFFLDLREEGGLAVNAGTIPYYNLLTETPWMIIGGIWGGYIIKWHGIRKTFIPMALCISLPNIAYVLLAIFQPETTVSFFGEQFNAWIFGAASFEALGYGVSFSAMFYYMHIMATESGRNKTSILAISFAIMNAGWFLPAMLSGFVQTAFGYTGLFALSCVAGLGIIFIIPWLPMPKQESEREK
jgi:MFS transporter, PAT family, beta-lactamase induction signal transducer AmpG